MAMPMSMSMSLATASAPKLAFSRFEVGDLALFLPWPRQQSMVAFNRGAPYRILSPRSREEHGIGPTEKNFFVGKITHIATLEATESHNPYDLPLGTKFYELDATKYDP